MILIFVCTAPIFTEGKFLLFSSSFHASNLNASISEHSRIGFSASIFLITNGVLCVTESEFRQIIDANVVP